VDKDDRVLLERLRGVNLESVYDALNRLGYVNQFMADLRVLRPDLKMVGRARTLRFLPSRPDLVKSRSGVPALNARAAEETEPGDILVVDIAGIRHAGFLGDVIATRFLTRGGAGIVVDGAIRDWGVLCEMPLPLYVRTTHASGTGTHILGVDYQVPVQCGGVTVIPGDLLLGDPEGVVVLPRALAEEVLASAESTDAKERFLRRKMEEEGLSVYECYPPSAAILAEFEASIRR
jgi:5-oxopent-3-ene-1,2,5-tricarboxylate decarboxylase / 2-hydroxyhepta-2,4-diene-1,7-dioate isomerase